MRLKATPIDSSWAESWKVGAIPDPAARRTRGRTGMTSTFQLSAQVLSIGIFFSLMIAGLSSKLPSTMAAGLQAHGVDARQAQRIAHLPPVSILFAAFLGYNPIKTLLGPKVLATLSTANANTLTGRSFFPHLIADPFRTGLHEAFAFSVAASALAALMSWSRGGDATYRATPPTPRRRSTPRPTGSSPTNRDSRRNNVIGPTVSTASSRAK